MYVYMYICREREAFFLSFVGGGGEAADVVRIDDDA